MNEIFVKAVEWGKKGLSLWLECLDLGETVMHRDNPPAEVTRNLRHLQFGFAVLLGERDAATDWDSETDQTARFYINHMKIELKKRGILNQFQVTKGAFIKGFEAKVVIQNIMVDTDAHANLDALQVEERRAHFENDRVRVKELEAAIDTCHAHMIIIEAWNEFEEGISDFWKELANPPEMQLTLFGPTDAQVKEVEHG